MTVKIKTLMVGAGVLAMAGCAGDVDIPGAFHLDAGAAIDTGGCGNATMRNMTAQMCTGRAKGYVVPDPVVVLDPKSPAGQPRYMAGTVTCSGQLNGKYAQVIWREYVGSATMPQQINGGGLAAIEGQAQGG